MNYYLIVLYWRARTQDAWTRVGEPMVHATTLAVDLSVATRNDLRSDVRGMVTDAVREARRLKATGEVRIDVIQTAQATTATFTLNEGQEP